MGFCIKKDGSRRFYPECHWAVYNNSRRGWHNKYFEDLKSVSFHYKHPKNIQFSRVKNKRLRNHLGINDEMYKQKQYKYIRNHLQCGGCRSLKRYLLVRKPIDFVKCRFSAVSRVISPAYSMRVTISYRGGKNRRFFLPRLEKSTATQ